MAQEIETTAVGEAPAKPSQDLGGWITSLLTGIPQPVQKVGMFVLGAMATQWVLNGGSFQSKPKRGRRR